MDDQTIDPSTGSGGVPERVQALLSRAVEDQLVEQRAVSTSLTDLSSQVSAVAEAVRGAASATTVEQLRSELTERFGALTQRVDEVVAAVSASERRLLAHVDEAVQAMTGNLVTRPAVRPDALLPDGTVRSALVLPEAEPEGLPPGLEENALGTGLLDVDELDRSIAAAEDVFDNDADAEVPVDAPAGGQEGPTGGDGTEVPVTDEEHAAVAAAVVDSPQDVAEPQLVGAVGPADASEGDNERGQTATGRRPGVTGGSAPRRARIAVPPLPPVMPASEAQEDGHDDDGRRRPWWRPGG